MDWSFYSMLIRLILWLKNLAISSSIYIVCKFRIYVTTEPNRTQAESELEPKFEPKTRIRIRIKTRTNSGFGFG